MSKGEQSRVQQRAVFLNNDSEQSFLALGCLSQAAIFGAKLAFRSLSDFSDDISDEL